MRPLGNIQSQRSEDVRKKDSLWAARRHAKGYLEYPLSFVGNALEKLSEVALPLERM